MLNRDSVVVAIWVNAVINGDRRRDEVPNISNLRTLVYEILDEIEAEKEE